MSSVTIFHNPACGTSRNTLAMIRASGTGTCPCRPSTRVLDLLDAR